MGHSVPSDDRYPHRSEWIPWRRRVLHPERLCPDLCLCCQAYEWGGLPWIPSRAAGADLSAAPNRSVRFGPDGCRAARLCRALSDARGALGIWALSCIRFPCSELGTFSAQLLEHADLVAECRMACLSVLPAIPLRNAMAAICNRAAVSRRRLSFCPLRSIYAEGHSQRGGIGHAGTGADDLRIRCRMSALPGGRKR